MSGGTVEREMDRQIGAEAVVPLHCSEDGVEQKGEALDLQKKHAIGNLEFQ